MGLKVQVADPSTGRILSVKPVFGTESAIFAESPLNLVSRFKSVDFTVAATQIIAEPETGGFVGVYDVLLSSKKLNATSIIVQFTDGTNVVKLVDFDNTTSIQEAITFSTLWTGWKDARLEAVTDGTFNATISISYVKLGNGLTFAEWDVRR